MSAPSLPTADASSTAMPSASSSACPDPATNTTPGQSNGSCLRCRCASCQNRNKECAGFKRRYEDGLERTRQGMLKGFRDIASKKDSMISELQGTNVALVKQLHQSKLSEGKHENEIEIMRQRTEELEKENERLRSEMEKADRDHKAQIQDWTTEMEAHLDAADAKIRKDQATAEADMRAASDDYNENLKAFQERVAKLESRVGDERIAKDSALLELETIKETHKLQLKEINMDLNMVTSVRDQLLSQIDAAIVTTTYRGDRSEFIASLTSEYVSTRDRIQGITNQVYASAKAAEYTGSIEDFHPWVADRLQDLAGELKAALTRPVKAAEEVSRQHGVITRLGEDNKKKNTKLAELEAETITLRSKMSVAGTKIADQMKIISDLEAGIQAKETTIQDTLIKCKQHTAKIINLKESVTSLQAVVEEKKTVITRQREEALAKLDTRKDEAARQKRVNENLEAEITEKVLKIKKQQEELSKWRSQGNMARRIRKREEAAKSGESLLNTLLKNVNENKQEKTETPVDVPGSLDALREELLKDNMAPPTLSQFRQMNRINAERILAEDSVKNRTRVPVQETIAPLPTVVVTTVQPNYPKPPVISATPDNTVFHFVARIGKKIWGLTLGI